MSLGEQFGKNEFGPASLQHPLFVLNTCSDRELTTFQDRTFYLWLSLAELKSDAYNFVSQLSCHPLESYGEVKFLLIMTDFEPGICILEQLYLSQ